jgi:hypothetical protein
VLDGRAGTFVIQHGGIDDGLQPAGKAIEVSPDVFDAAVVLAAARIGT